MIAIKDMEMPKSCEECQFRHWNRGYNTCGINKGTISREWQSLPPDYRPSWCPLIDLTDDGKNIFKKRNSCGAEIHTPTTL